LKRGAGWLLFRGSELAVFTGMALLQADDVDEINGARWALPNGAYIGCLNGNFVEDGVKKLLHSRAAWSAALASCTRLDARWERAAAEDGQSSNRAAPYRVVQRMGFPQ
jgi:hypothetical protein